LPAFGDTALETILLCRIEEDRLTVLAVEIAHRSIVYQRQRFGGIEE
jgi:hypothetical protein